jgi:dipeptidyl aminopeptidase/acylaminoacyl peptidase
MMDIERCGRREDPSRTPFAPAIAAALGVPLVDDAQLSPDGTQVAFTLAETWRLPAQPAHSAVHVVSCRDQQPSRRASAGFEPARLPRWRPLTAEGGGRAGLAFVAQSGTRIRICVADLDRGGVCVLGDVEGVAGDLRWSPDGRRLAFTLTEPPSYLKVSDGKDVIIGDTEQPWTRLWLLDPSTADCRPVNPIGTQIWEFDWAPDGRALAVIASDGPGEGYWYQAWLAVLDLDGVLGAPLYRSARQVVRPAWSPDGQWIAFLASRLSDRDVGSGDVWIVPPRGGPARDLTADHEWTPTWITWTGSAMLTVTGHEGTEAFFATLTLDGRLTTLWRDRAALGHHRWPRFSAAPGGWPVAVVREDFHHPLDVWIVEPVAEPVCDAALRWRRLTDLHSDWEKWPLGRAEVVSWRARDDLEIQGILLWPSQLPSQDKPARSLPAVTVVHGGPTNLWSSRPLLLWQRLLTMMGGLVFLPNPRGSTGRGVAFAEANHADFGGGDWDDIVTGVEALVQRGLADPARLGLAGWSYGGFMTAWGVGQTDRFRAAVMGAGISNWVSFHGTTPLHTWDAASFGGDPHRDALHRARSPITCVDRVHTPTLIVHGLADSVVPADQSREFFRALRDRGVEAELCLYPREGHFLGESYHQAHMIHETLQWFARLFDLDAGTLQQLPPDRSP